MSTASSLPVRARLATFGRRCIITAAAAGLTAGLGAGVASADATTPEASTASSVQGSWTGTKDSASDLFNCKKHPQLFFCALYR